MNSILIVLPILTLLMFQLGLTLQLKDFSLIFSNPKPVLVALFGQIILLPLIAVGLGLLFNLPPLLFIGLILIACCPGGSSSNVFSYLAKGDVALSVTLTALSSVITLFTLPFIMNIAVNMIDTSAAAQINLPVKNLLIQNLLLVFLPIGLGMVLRYKKEKISKKIEKILGKLAFPLLMLLAGIFFIQNFSSIVNNFLQLGTVVTALLILTTLCAYLLSKIFALKKTQQRTIIIEVGMQNAAQAIAVASSPFIFNNNVIAEPAVIYALMMNVVLLTYVGIIKAKEKNIE
ncbi:MAG: bile acid:sodium symporter family protein [Bacteroidales bacterium]|nr:bile acid:sodium symporter family protein [Bacteroidales bacterium]